MAESFASAIAGTVLGKLGSLTYQGFSSAWGVKHDIQELEETLNTINTVLLDAEEQQAHNPKLRLWLENLKKVCYDAEDVLDDIEVEALRKQVIVKHGSITRKVRHFFSCPKSLAFRFKVSHKIKEIRERLDKIAADKTNFNLSVEGIENKHYIIRERETHSFVLASDIIGRDEDKEEIIKLITSSTDGQNISVLPIVGIGGLGKTALAKLVYNDERVDKCFALKMWVCVSENFELKQVMMKIVKSATNQNYNDLDVNQLQRILRENLIGKKYLLILDDVWNEVSERWTELKILLMGGADGSRILVTTRSLRVASIMGTMPYYKLKGLSDDECLSLFVQCAFKEGQEKLYPHLVRIGEEIIRKCGGIPLAVRTLGSLLYSSLDEQEWKKVRDNEIWELDQKENDILHALRLSYNHLPPYLKQCFAYCSVFPKDFPFFNLILIEFWMAHGLIKSPGGNEDLENIGNQYLNKLISRSFFQDFEYAFGFYKFKMHDLMHDLATSMMKSECIIVKPSCQVCPKSIRHLAFDYWDTPEIDSSNFFFGSYHIRTILYTFENQGPSQSFFKSIISNCQFLQFLYLEFSNIEVLPKEIGNLKHLRFLDLNCNHRIKKLPSSICKLQSLQTLTFVGCKEIKELPRDIRWLISLRTLWLSTKQKNLQEKGIGSLVSLRYLSIGESPNLEHLFEDIDRLKVLKKLTIGYCPSLISLPEGVKYLGSLEELYLTGCEKLNINLSMGPESEDNHQDLKHARPQLRNLGIDNLPQLVEFPQWLLQASTNTLQRLLIQNCSNFKALPEPMRNLQTLEEIIIANCPELTSLPNDMNCLTALRNLAIVGCPTLSKRCAQGIGEDWSKICHVSTIQLIDEIIESSNN